jgi:hypothetical protein
MISESCLQIFSSTQLYVYFRSHWTERSVSSACFRWLGGLQISFLMRFNLTPFSHRVYRRRVRLRESSDLIPLPDHPGSLRLTPSVTQIIGSSLLKIRGFVSQPSSSKRSGETAFATSSDAGCKIRE